MFILSDWLLLLILFLPFIHLGKASKRFYFNNPMWPGKH
uniref:Uncharacterized protein n=1 Tax=Rhizophora mucronata TaxID=61149 RepID=A0A2P2LTP0_RHIMU